MEQRIKEEAIEIIVSNLVMAGKLQTKDIADHVMLLNGCEYQALSTLLCQSRNFLDKYYLEMMITSRN